MEVTPDRHRIALYVWVIGPSFQVVNIVLLASHFSFTEAKIKDGENHFGAWGDDLSVERGFTFYSVQTFLLFPVSPLIKQLIFAGI